MKPNSPQPPVKTVNVPMHEHDKVRSKTTGRNIEIRMTLGKEVPKNPFASLAQAGYMHSHPEILGKAGLKEWDEASKGRKIPYKVKGK
jgi:hypothetical protein